MCRFEASLGFVPILHAAYVTIAVLSPICGLAIYPKLVTMERELGGTPAH